MVDTTGTTTYGYDDLYRLTAVTYPNSDTQSYTYDAMGNRLTKVDNSVTTTYTYDNAGQMTAVDSTSYTYDGNTTAAGSDTYTWDAENRLAGTTTGGVTSTYGYNGAGLRTSQTTGGVTVNYAWDLTGSLPNILQDSAGNRYVYGLDLISKTNGTTQEYYLTDGLGSTTGITDGSGTVTGTYEYDAFGAVRAQTGATTEWSYTGEQHDATGLEYLRARYYDASTGRFLSQDPMPLLQRYAYANDNPANLVDPSGMSPESDRFHQLMAAEEQVQAWAKQILSDPCWKTHAFCAHVALVWKKVKENVREYGWDCAIGGATGMAAGALTGAGALLGGAVGCVGGVASAYADHRFGGNPGENSASQCVVGGAAGGVIAVLSENPEAFMKPYLAGCLTATFLVLDHSIGADNNVTQCALAAIGSAVGGETKSQRRGLGAIGCGGAIALRELPH